MLKPMVWGRRGGSGGWSLGKKWNRLILKLKGFSVTYPLSMGTKKPSA